MLSFDQQWWKSIALWSYSGSPSQMQTESFLLPETLQCHLQQNPRLKEASQPYTRKSSALLIRNSLIHSLPPLLLGQGPIAIRRQDNCHNILLLVNMACVSSSSLKLDSIYRTLQDVGLDTLELLCSIRQKEDANFKTRFTAVNGAK